MKTRHTIILLAVATVVMSVDLSFSAPPYSGIRSAAGRQTFTVEADGDVVAGGIVIPRSFLPPQSSWFGMISMHPRPQQDWTGELQDIVLVKVRTSSGMTGGNPNPNPTSTPTPTHTSTPTYTPTATLTNTPTSARATPTFTPTSSLRSTPSPTPLPPTATPFPAEKAISIEFQSLSLEVISTNSFDISQTSPTVNADSFLMDDYNNLWFTKLQREIYLQLPNGKVRLAAGVVNLSDKLHVVEQQLALARYRKFEGYDGIDFLCVRHVQERALPARSWKIVTHYRLIGNFEKFSSTTVDGFIKH